MSVDAKDEVLEQIVIAKETGPGFKICSFNINGLRTIHMGRLLRQGLGFKPNILCVQETKTRRSQLPENQALIDNHTSYFSFSKNRAGYSGVATYCRNDMTPSNAESGLFGTNVKADDKHTETVGDHCDIDDEIKEDAKYADNDGRAVITQHIVLEPDGTERFLNVINVYCPRLRDDPSDPVNNRQFKRTFHNMLLQRAQKMVQNGQFVLVVGDFNVSHKLIDQACIQDPKLFIQTEFRDWMDEFVLEDKDSGFRDTYRTKNPDTLGAYTCWETRTSARVNNYGSRIDYIVADTNLMKYLDDAEVHQFVMGSDHCPISATFHSLILKPSATVPNLATKYFPEFQGRQQNLLDFFKKESTATSNQVKAKQKEATHGRKRIIKSSKKQTYLSAFVIKKPKLDSDDKDDVRPEQTAPGDDSTGAETQDAGLYLGTHRNNENVKAAWAQMMKLPEPVFCTGHNERAQIRTCKQAGPNYGRRFLACAHAVGQKGDKNASCNFFQWEKSRQ